MNTLPSLRRLALVAGCALTVLLATGTIVAVVATRKPPPVEEEKVREEPPVEKEPPKKTVVVAAPSVEKPGVTGELDRAACPAVDDAHGANRAVGGMDARQRHPVIARDLPRH